MHAYIQKFYPTRCLNIFTYHIIIIILILASIDVYGISHDIQLPREFPSFTDNEKSDQNLKGNINNNASIPENSKIKDKESKNELIKPLPSELTVVTQVNNEGGGKKNPSDFTIQVDGNNPNPSSFSGDSDGTIVKIDQGKYSVSESGSSGYTVSKSSSCSGTINPGQTKTCTITFTYNSPILTGTLKIIKKVVNDEGGSKKPSDFTITVNGKDPQPTSFPGSSAGVTVNLKKGSYSVTETSPSDYNVEYSSSCLGSINPGDKITCTVTNIYQAEDQSAELIVIKDIVNNYNNDESATKLKPSAFTIKVSGNDPSPKSFPGRSGSGITVTLDPGSYSVAEKGPPGYSTNYSNDCEGKIKSGQVRVCIITNEFNPSQPVIPAQPQLSLIGTISGLALPYGMAFKPDNNLLYITNSEASNNNGSISVINTTTNNVNTIMHLGNNPKSIIYNSGNDLIYVSNSNSGEISVINSTTNLITNTINIGNFLGTGLSGIEVNPVNNTIYVTNSGLNIISIINATSNTLIGNISQTIGKFFTPYGIAYNDDNDNLYVTNRGSDTVSVINSTTKTLEKLISTGGIAPSSIIYNPVNNNLYVTNTGSNTVSIINGTTNNVIKTIPTGLQPIGIAYNEYNGNVYTTNSINGTVSIIDGFGNTVVDTIDISGNDNNLAGIVFNSNNENVYVADTSAGSISIIG
ncbi:MAG TPA: beta-propeller fold lactonase family protein [Nitrososphaeraceae archaeon]|nr:beta-propeller fold lactonase family protein [Nitrososphaeraceae archaeon]